MELALICDSLRSSKMMRRSDGHTHYETNTPKKDAKTINNRKMNHCYVWKSGDSLKIERNLMANKCHNSREKKSKAQVCLNLHDLCSQKNTQTKCARRLRFLFYLWLANFWCRKSYCSFCVYVSFFSLSSFGWIPHKMPHICTKIWLFVFSFLTLRFIHVRICGVERTHRLLHLLDCKLMIYAKL